MPVEAWELLFMMVVLKLPILYLLGVVWWAIRAEPEPYEPAIVGGPAPESDPERPRVVPCAWQAHHRRPRPPARGRRIVAGARR